MELSKNLNRDMFILIAILIGFMICYAYVFDTKIDMNGDNASYYMLGKALWQGEGYVSINSVFKSPNNHFPPGYPVIISGLLHVWDSFTAVKLLNGILLLCTLMLSYLLVRDISGNDAVAMISIPFLLVNTHLLRFSTIMMSEIPFLFFSLLSIYFFFKAYNQTGKREITNYIAAFIFFMVAFYIRTLGIALLASFGLVVIFDLKKKWKVLAAFIPAFVLSYAPWWLRSQHLGGNSYIKQLVMINPYRPELGRLNVGDLYVRIIKNIERYITREIPDVLFPFKTFDYRDEASIGEWITGVLIAVIIIVGIVNLKRYKKLVVGYMGSTFVVLLLWPDVWVGVRFVLPLLPFLLMGFLNGVQYLLTAIHKKLIFTKIMPFWAVLLILIAFYPDVRNLHQKARKRYEPKWNNYFAIAKWFRKREITGVVVSCRKPVMFYLFSGTFTTNYKYTQDDKDLIADLKVRKTDYVVIDQLGYSSTIRYLIPAIQNNSDQFELILHFEQPDTYLLKLLP